jgi:hypothetical protein
VTVFRLAVIVMVLSAVALAMVYLRWSNAHYAYLTQKAWHQQRLLCYEYQQRRLDLARMKNPKNLLQQLDKWEFDLEGWVPTTPPDGTVKKTTSQPASKSKPKSASNKTAKPSAKTARSKASDKTTKSNRPTSANKKTSKGSKNDKTPAKKNR